MDTGVDTDTDAGDADARDADAGDAVARDADVTPIERRQGGDRRSRRRYRYRDRRSGFERRTAGVEMGVVKRTIYALRDRPRALAWVLIVTNALNVADFLFTLLVLESGVTREANPILRPLLALNPLLAGLFKVALILAATLLVWKSRHYALALTTALVMLVVFVGLIAYHVVLMALLS